MPEIGWYIYGNTIVYNSNFLEECKDGHGPTHDIIDINTGTLRYMMLLLIIYGYFYMLIALGVLIFFPTVLCLIKSKTDDEILEIEVETQQDYFDNMTNMIGGELLISYR